MSNAERQIANMPGWRGPKLKTDAAPPFPTELQYLWLWFSEHCWGLQVNGMTQPRVTWEGLAAWSDITGIELLPWEARAMVKLGNLRANELMAPKEKTPDAPDRPHRANGKKHRRNHSQ